MIILKRTRRELDKVYGTRTIELRQGFASEFTSMTHFEKSKWILDDECGFNLLLSRSVNGTRANFIVPEINAYLRDKISRYNPL